MGKYETVSQNDIRQTNTSKFDIVSKRAVRPRVQGLKARSYVRISDKQVKECDCTKTLEMQMEIITNSNLSDKAAAIYNIMYSLGSITGLFTGGVMYEKVGYNLTVMLVAVLAGAMGIIYLLAIIVCRPNN